jgi:signal peptidase I
MLPTLRSGQMVMTDRTHYWNHSPRRGEVVVIRHAGETCIKRIYGMPGETLYWVGDTDQPLVPIAQEMAPDLCRRWRGHARPVATRVPPDCVFVLGDNLLQSMDSRTFGPVPIRELVGRARLPVDLGPLRDHEFVPPDRHGRRQTRSAFRASL